MTGTGGAPVLLVLGIDGAGKTTQAKLLAASLEERGFGVTRFVGPRPSFVQQALDPIARDLGRKDCWSLLDADAIRLAGSLATLRDLTREVLPALDTDRHFVVMDRYAHCQYAVGRVFGATNEALIRRLCSILPVPALTFYLDVGLHEADHRIRLRGEDDETLEYLAALDAAYRALPEAEAYVHVDGERPIQSVHAELCAAVSDRFPETWSPLAA